MAGYTEVLHGPFPWLPGHAKAPRGEYKTTPDKTSFDRGTRLSGRTILPAQPSRLWYVHSVSPRLLIALLLLFPCAPQERPMTDTDRIRRLIADYVAAVDAADIKLAAQVWDNSPDVSFIHPLGQAHGWGEVKAFFSDIMGGMFSERKLTPRDIQVHVYGDSAWSEFNWHFTGTQKKDGASVQTDGRETQIYRQVGNRWVLVHVHYSEMPRSR
jgi:ketosteroid isomerase-like protein